MQQGVEAKDMRQLHPKSGLIRIVFGGALAAGSVTLLFGASSFLCLTHIAVFCTLALYLGLALCGAAVVMGVLLRRLRPPVRCPECASPLHFGLPDDNEKSTPADGDRVRGLGLSSWLKFLRFGVARCSNCGAEFSVNTVDAE